MTKHDPNRVQWNHLFKLIKKTEANGIAIYDLAEELNKEKSDLNLETAIEQLLKHGRIRIMTGYSKSGMICRVVQAIPDAKEFKIEEDEED